jgi:hypothetical protein
MLIDHVFLLTLSHLFSVDKPCFLEMGIVEPAKFLKGRKLLLAKTLVNPQNQVILSSVNLVKNLSS